MDFTIKGAIEILLTLVLVVAPFYSLQFAKDRRDANGKPMGFGVRLIQYLTVAMALPTIIILALEQIIDNAVVGTLLGGLLGYVLSNISDYTPPSKGTTTKSKTNEPKAEELSDEE